MTALLLSLVIPVRNEAGSLRALYERILSALREVSRYTVEIVFVNDGSTDESQTIITSIANADPRVKYLEFSRNFGKEVATTAGIAAASGDVVLTLDSDLQHPPEHIPEFLHKWEQGAEVVIGVRQGHAGEGFVKRLGSYGFYRIMTAISDLDLVPGETDFRLITRQVACELNRFSERNRITRGLINWMGFRHDYVYFKAAQRHAGVAAYSFRKLLTLAVTSFVGHSLIPLQLAGYLGICITVGSALLGSFMFFDKYVLGDPFGLNFSGPATLAVLTLFLVGVILICLGLMTLYIANIHVEVVDRPLYILRSSNLVRSGVSRSTSAEDGKC